MQDGVFDLFGYHWYWLVPFETLAAITGGCAYLFSPTRKRVWLRRAGLLAVATGIATALAYSLTTWVPNGGNKMTPFVALAFAATAIVLWPGQSQFARVGAGVASASFFGVLFGSDLLFGLRGNTPAEGQILVIGGQGVFDNLVIDPLVASIFSAIMVRIWNRYLQLKSAATKIGPE